MSYCAQIDTNNICVAVSELAGECPVNTIELQSYDTSVLGKEWNGTAFIAVPVPPAPATYKIAVGAFFDRFDTYGGQKLAILSSADATVQALVKDSQARKFIDLQRPDIGPSIDLLIFKGFAVDKVPLMTTPATEHELP